MVKTIICKTETNSYILGYHDSKYKIFLFDIDRFRKPYKISFMILLRNIQYATMFIAKIHVFIDSETNAFIMRP